MLSNLTHPFILNATLNATLYQPSLPWYNAAWLSVLSQIFVGIALVVATAILAMYTKKLWGSTSRYSEEVGIQTGIMNRNIKLAQKHLEIDERNRRRERLVKEMDKLIGPLYSRIYDKQIFNPRGTGGGRYWNDASSDKINKQLYEEGTFWQEVAQYKYLAPLDLRTKIDTYLEIKLGSTKVMKWDDPKYIEPEKSLKDAVIVRYNSLEGDLYMLDQGDKILINEDFERVI